jgi:hypothetical protein
MTLYLGLTMRFYTGFIKKFTFLFSAALILCAVFPQKSKAENVNKFFGKNDVLNFDKPMSISNGAHIEILNPDKKEKPESTKENKPGTTSKDAVPEGDLVSKYGDPSTEFPVTAQENAPLPFKGMMAALQVGDKKLAAQYAKQYVQYMQKLDKTAKDAVQLQMEAEQLLSQAGAEKDPAALASAEIPQAAGVEKASLKPLSDEESIRKEMREKIAGKAPVDPKGEVEFYFFFRSNDPKSIQMGAEFEKFAAANSSDPKLLIKALTSEKEDQGTIEAYRAKSGAKFRIENGSEFARQLGITKVPAIAAIAKNSGQATIEEGIRNFYYLDELLKAMKGGR